MDATNLGVIIKRSELNEWDKNSKDVSQEGYDRTREQVEMLGQYKPLLVTKVGDRWIILGGHTRWKIYNELEVEDLWCSVVDFFEGDQGIWKARVNGVEAPETYESREEGMATYSLSDNDESGFYIQNKVKLNFAPLNIKHNFGLTITPPPTLEEMLKSREQKENSSGGNGREMDYIVISHFTSEEEQEEAYTHLTNLGYDCEKDQGFVEE